MTYWSNPCNSDIKSGARIIAKWLAGGEWPYLSFRDPLGYGGVKTNYPIEQIRKRWANAD